jgi:hypothetical protein
MQGDRAVSGVVPLAPDRYTSASPAHPVEPGSVIQKFTPNGRPQREGRSRGDRRCWRAWPALSWRIRACPKVLTPLSGGPTAAHVLAHGFPPVLNPALFAQPLALGQRSAASADPGCWPGRRRGPCGRSILRRDFTVGLGRSGHRESRRLIALGRPGFDGLGRRGPPARWRERLAAGARQHIGQAVASPAAEVLGRAPAVAAIVEVGTVVALLGHGKAPVQFSAEIRERDSIHGCTLSLSRQPQNLRADLGG